MIDLQSDFRRLLLTGGAIQLCGKFVSQVCSFLRNIVIARLIGAENFGIAATFSITVSVVEMLGSLSVDKLLIQAKDGANPDLKAAAHSVQLLRGLGGSLILLIIALPTAQLFGVREASWAFFCLAIIPLVRGINHLDAQTAQRDLNYRPAVLIEVSQQLLTLMISWPLAAILRDYSAMLWLLILQNIFSSTASFLVSRNRYQLNFSSTEISRFLRFGWPLLINSILLFGVFQGDRFLIGACEQIFGVQFYSKADLGLFSVALLLTITPMTALSNVLSSTLLPVFAKHQDSFALLHRDYSNCFQMVAFISGLFAIPFILLGHNVVTLLYGRQFGQAGAIIVWLAIGYSFRLLRSVPNSAALALADTHNAMYSNLLRAAALFVSAVLVASGSRLFAIAAVGSFAEFVAFCFSCLLLKRNHSVPLFPSAKAIPPLLTAISTAGLCSFLVNTDLFITRSIICSCIVGGYIFFTLFFFPPLRYYLDPRGLVSWAGGNRIFTHK